MEELTQAFLQQPPLYLLFFNHSPAFKTKSDSSNQISGHTYAGLNPRPWQAAL